MFFRLLISMAFIFSSAFVYATPQQLLQKIHSMRLDSTNAITNYYMFSGLAADSKYEQRILKNLERFDEALEYVEGQADNNDISTDIKEIAENWKIFKDLMDKNRSDIKVKGHPDFIFVIKMMELNNKMVDQLTTAYLAFQKSSGIVPNKQIQKARDLALLMEKITNAYSLRASTNMTHVYSDIGDSAILADSFHKLLESLVTAASSPKTETLLDNIQKKWSFIEAPIRNFNENTVVFIVVSYNDRIVDHLQELEELL